MAEITHLKTLEDTFNNVYVKIKLQLYKRLLQRLETREASLSTVETFSVEVIDALGAPTLSEFAKAAGISVANATYKVQNLIRKGYIQKQRSEADRRESHLHVTERFNEYKKLHTEYINTVVKRVEASCSPADVAAFRRVLKTIDDELMPEVALGDKTAALRPR
ncbi:MAG TPA: MarR family transcriptional regulator [Coriobacteriia bacterium]|nr:MarR family transcriptional regulator [Coriobacteriia bacterium]